MNIEELLSVNKAKLKAAQDGFESAKSDKTEKEHSNNIGAYEHIVRELEKLRGRK